MKALLNAKLHVDVTDEEFRVLYERSKTAHTAFGRELRKAREDKGISLRSAAALFKISPSHLSDIELGKKPANRKMRDWILRKFTL